MGSVPVKREHLIMKLKSIGLYFLIFILTFQHSLSISALQQDTFHTNTSIDEIKNTQWKKGMSYSRWCASVCHVSLQILLREADETARLPMSV